MELAIFRGHIHTLRIPDTNTEKITPAGTCACRQSGLPKAKNDCLKNLDFCYIASYIPRSIFYYVDVHKMYSPFSTKAINVHALAT